MIQRERGTEINENIKSVCEVSADGLAKQLWMRPKQCFKKDYCRQNKTVLI